jgi:hypothetical protein
MLFQRFVVLHCSGRVCGSLITPSEYSVPQSLLLLEESLKKVDTSNYFALCGIIDQYAQQPSLKESSSLVRVFMIG